MGIVHGFRGRPTSVASGGGPERSTPNSRRFDGGPPGAQDRPRQSGRHRLRRALKRHAAALTAAADLDLGLILGQGPAPNRHPERAAQQLGVGELLARIGLTVVVERLEPRLPELVVEPLGELHAPR